MRITLLPAVVLTAHLLAGHLLTGCALFAPEEEDPVEVTAAEEAEGIRVHFFLREADVSDKKVEITADAGQVIDYVRSNDLRHVSVLWKDPDRTIRAKFPYGEEGEFTSGDEVLEHQFAYLFHQGKHSSVTAMLARGAPIMSRLMLTVDIDKEALPATFQWEGRKVRKLVRERSFLIIEFPASKDRVLETGDWTVTLTTKHEKEQFRIGLDSDGVPTATTGHVRRAQ